MNILITAIGRRVQLIKHFIKDNYVVGVDCQISAPAKHIVDKFYNVTTWNDNEYINDLMTICKKESVELIIPLYEKELSLLANKKKDFEELGVKVLVSSEEIIDIFNDKIKTYEFFINNGIDTPITYTKKEIFKAIKDGEVNFPLIVKPSDGMGSKNVFIVKDEKELKFFAGYIKQPIIQEFIDGEEYTIDVLCDLHGQVISIVPRKRIEVRAGEVSKSKCVYNFKIIDKVKDIISKIKKVNLDCIGPLTVQCIVNKHGQIKFIELNPRFGGGVPLTIEAGISYSEYITKSTKKIQSTQELLKFKEITMLRYDEAFFIEGEL